MLMISCVFLLLILTQCTIPSFANDKTTPRQLPSYQQSSFVIPKILQKDIIGYPEKWRHLSGYNHSALHWQQFVTVFINQSSSVYANNYVEFMRSLSDEFDDEEDRAIAYQTYPVGTIILKESFLNENAKPGKALFLSGMIKRPIGYDTKFGDWEYFQSDQQGNLLIHGNSTDVQAKTTCVNCHNNIADKDFVFSTHYSINPL